MTDARKYVTLDGHFPMHRGGYLDSPTLAYETWGELNAAKDNCIIIFSGLSPSAHAASSPEDPSAGWWEDMIGSGFPLDTDRFFILCVNSLGSCFGSTGAASVDPETGDTYRLRFPTLTLEDVAEAAYRVVSHLGIESVHTVLGCSMGGMSGLAFCVRHPDAVRNFISVSSAARALPFSIAVRSLQREMIRSDPKWNLGNYTDEEPPAVGQRLARKLGMITYRSAAEWAERFGRERAPDFGETDNPFGIDFEVESYLESHANRFIGSFDANCYLYLSRAMDLFDAADHGGSLDSCFAELDLEAAMVIGVETDFLFPVAQQEELALALDKHVPEVTFKRLASIQGHDSFLVDMDRFRPAVASFF